MKGSGVWQKARREEHTECSDREVLMAYGIALVQSGTLVSDAWLAYGKTAVQSSTQVLSLCVYFTLYDIWIER